MKYKDVEQTIKQAFTHAVPDVLPSILSDCEQQRGRIIVMTDTRKNNPWIKRFAAIAAAFVLVVAGTVTGYLFHAANYAVDSIVALEVNPSLEITVNQKEKVLAVEAKNEEARTVIGDMDFKGNQLDVTVNALIGSMLRNGYLNEIANSILVSVDNDDHTKATELQTKLASNIDAMLQTETFSGSVLSQTLHHEDDLDDLAEQYGITLGKAQLIQEIINQNDLYTFDGLVPLSINELNLLIESNEVQLSQVQSTGEASDKAYIGKEKAKDIALKHANLKESQVTMEKVKLDYDDGRAEYEVEFRKGTTEYDYDIDAVSGNVLSYDVDKDNDDDRDDYDDDRDDYDDDRDDYDDDRDDDDDAPVQNNQSSNNTSNELISKTKARNIALNHAGLSSSSVTFVKTELDYDDGRPEYEVEFYKGGTEYDYEIDARTGKILDFDHDAEGYTPPQNNQSTSNNTSNELISKSKAKSIALDHAGLSSSSVTFVKVELDYDDGVPEYEVEFYKGSTEYDYEINAKTGKIISYDHDAEDYDAPQNNQSSGNTSGGLISKSEAKSIALNRAGISSSGIYDYEIELDEDDGIYVYEIEFKKGNYEYSFEINAKTGKVLEYDKEYDD